MCLPRVRDPYRNLAEALGARGHGPVNLTALWASADDERKFSREAVEALLHAGLLNAMEVDNALARAVMGRSGAAADTVAHLINTVVLKDKLLSYTVGNFTHTRAHAQAQAGTRVGT